MIKYIYILVLCVTISMICACNSRKFSKNEAENCTPVMTKGMKIEATNDYGTLIIIADKDSQRIIGIKDIDNPHKFAKIPAKIREDWKDQSEPVIGYKGSISKLWDKDREVFISKIDYFENSVDFATIEEANAVLKESYDEWIERLNARVTDSKVYFNYAWTDNGLLVYWSIHQPEYWVIPNSYYIYLIVEQIYVDGKKPEGLIKCPHPSSELKAEYLTDEQLKAELKKQASYE